MTQRETNLRSVLFLVIGILLLLSLVICVYIVSTESDLVKVAAEVTIYTQMTSDKSNKIPITKNKTLLKLVSL